MAFCYPPLQRSARQGPAPARVHPPSPMSLSLPETPDWPTSLIYVTSINVNLPAFHLLGVCVPPGGEKGNCRTTGFRAVSAPGHQLPPGGSRGFCLLSGSPAELRAQHKPPPGKDFPQPPEEVGLPAALFPEGVAVM